HEMIFKSSAHDLALVVEILRTDEADHAVHQKRLEGAGHTVSSCFERELIDAVVGLRGKGAALAGLEIHDVVIVQVRVHHGGAEARRNPSWIVKDWFSRLVIGFYVRCVLRYDTSIVYLRVSASPR